MKILLLANQDLASCVALNHLLPELHQAQHQLRLMLSARVGSSTTLPTALKTLNHYEQALFINTVFPRLEHQTTNAVYLSLNQLGEQYCDKPVMLENKINSEAGIHSVSDYQPDLMISIRYGVILKQAIIDIPRHGIINLHSGKLPDYRGVMATFWAMLNGEKTIQTTLHWIDSNAIDDGGIIAITNEKVDYRKSYLENVLSLYPGGVQLILNTVAKISDAQPVATHKSHAQGNYYSFPDDNDLKKFHDNGYQLVNESSIQNLINNKFTAR